MFIMIIILNIIHSSPPGLEVSWSVISEGFFHEMAKYV